MHMAMWIGLCSQMHEMNTTNMKRRSVFLSALMILLVPVMVMAQTRMGSGNVKVTIEGTSNIHDWIMTSDKGSAQATFTTDASGNPTAISNLNFTVAVKSLKSEKGSTMDNNAYKAMGAEANPNIRFSSATATVKPNGGNSFTITAPGKLSISTGSRDVTLVATGKLNADRSMKIDGSYKLVTTDYNVKAISIMLGAIKTSANVNIVYSLTMKPE